jgi:hypothetical protein
VLTKTSGGTLNLTGASGAFLGATTVGAGTLSVSGTLGGTLAVQSGAVLKGTGAVGATTVETGGVLSPGDGVGSLNMSQGLTLNADSNLVFEFRESTGTFDLDPGAGGVQSGPGVSWDLIDLGAGMLNLGAPPPDNKIQLVIDAWQQDNSGHATSAAQNNFDPLAEYADGWLFIKVDNLSQLNGSAAQINDYFAIVDNHNPNAPAGALTGVGGVFDTGNPFVRPPQGMFSVAWKTVGTQSGLYIQYSAIPEPGSMILCGLGALGLGWYRRRRLKKHAAPATSLDAQETDVPDTTPA